MLLTAVLQAINAVLGQVIASKGKMWDGFILNLCWALIISITALLFIKNNLGAIGLSIAVLISYISHTTLVLFYILKNNKK